MTTQQLLCLTKEAEHALVVVKEYNERNKFNNLHYKDGFIDAFIYREEEIGNLQKNLGDCISEKYKLKAELDSLRMFVRGNIKGMGDL